MEIIESNTLKGLKICFIAGTLGMGGAERQLFLIISSLIRMEADVSLICLNSGEYWENAIRQTGAHYYTFGRRGGKVARLFKIISLLTKIMPKIVQSQHFYTNIYVALGAFFCGAKSIGASRLSLKVEIDEKKFIYGRMSFLLPQYFAMNSKESIEYGTKISNGKKRIFYLPNAIDDLKFRPALHEKTHDVFILLGMGRLENQKRFDKFIDMIALLKNAYKGKVKGIIVGAGSLKSELKDKAKLLQLTNVELEFVSETDSPEVYMQKSDCFVLTSDFEGNPNVVLEAMACGLPVVTTKVGNLPYFIRDKENGFFFDGTVDDLFRKVDNLIKNQERLDLLAFNARKTIEDNFSLKALENNLVYIYNQITKQVNKN